MIDKYFSDGCYGQLCIDCIRDIFQLVVVILKSLRQPGHRLASRPYGVFFRMFFCTKKGWSQLNWCIFAQQKKTWSLAHCLRELSRMNLWPVLFPLNPPLMGSNAFVPCKPWKKLVEFSWWLDLERSYRAIFGWMAFREIPFATGHYDMAWKLL